MTTANAINTIEDLTRILRERPEWRDEIRKLVLTDELLTLPQRFSEYAASTDRRLDELTQVVQELARGQQELRRDVQQLAQSLQELTQCFEQYAEVTNRRLESLEGRMGNLEGHMGSLEGRANNLEGRVGNLEGSDYEAKVARLLPTRIRHENVANLNNPQVVYPVNGNAPALDRLLQRALNNGAISHDQMTDLLDSDVIIASNDNRYAVVESSITLAERDINRAIARAALMSRITGSETVPVVASANIADEERSFAEERGVSIIRILYR